MSEDDYGAVWDSEAKQWRFRMTQEQFDAATYLQWDDRSLGQMMKTTALRIPIDDDQTGRRRIYGMSAALLLIGMAQDSNAEELTVSVDGVTHGGEPIGDYRVVIEKVKD